MPGPKITANVMGRQDFFRQHTKLITNIINEAPTASRGQVGLMGRGCPPAE